MKTGVDSVAMTATEWRGLLQGISPPPNVIGCYGNGMYANHTAAREASPHAIILVYDVNGSMPECDALDVEPRDAVPNQSHGWAQRHNAVKIKRTFPHPFLYGSASIVSQIISDMLDHGWKRNQFFIQSAHYTKDYAHICGPGKCQYPKVDSTQHWDKGPRGQNLDMTLYEDHCFGAVPVPDPDANYHRFDSTKRRFGSEQDLAREYDKWRALQTHDKHPHRARLAFLRLRLGVAARRLRKLGHPDLYDRKWRLRELDDRRMGRRLV